MRNLLIGTAVAVALAGAAAADTKLKTKMAAENLRHDMIVSSQGSSGAIVWLIIMAIVVFAAGFWSGGNGASSMYYPYYSLASDKRLKTDMRRVGTSAMGLPIYQYRYVGHDKWCEGVSAQDVQRLVPDAVSKHETGYLMVDYNKIDVRPRMLTK